MSKNENVRKVVTDATAEQAAQPKGCPVMIPTHNDRAINVPKQGTRINACPSNLDLSTMFGKAMMLKAMSPSDLDVEPTEPLKLVAHHWCLIPDTREDEETGEINEFVRTIFFGRDGRCFRTSSAHSPMRLCAMLELFTPDEWAKGVPLIVSVRKSKRGRLYHDIQVDLESRYGI